jgi:hypothetical protein
MNLERARSTGRVKFWRYRGESQRVKAEIVWLHQMQPQLSQRAIAQRLHCKQPYVARVLKRARLSGCDIEKAIGWEAYEHYKALRDAERTKRHEAVIAESQHSQGQTTPPPQSDSQGNSVNGDARHGSSTDGGTIPAHQKGPTEYVELGRTTTGEVIELRGSAPPYAQPPAPQPALIQRNQGPSALKQIADAHDAPLLAFIGYNPNRSKGWF